MKYRPKYLYLTIIASALIILMLGIFLILVKPEIVLNGKKEIVLNLNDEYVEEGAFTKNTFQKLKYKIKISNNIDNKKTGTYEVIYQISYHGKKITNKRKVIIKDKVAPIIELTGDENINICPNKEYQEPGYKATDNYDGDITNKVEIKVEKINDLEYKIKYYVQDSSKNESTVYRSYTISDKENPIITLAGSTNITLLKGNTYKEPGYTANDNCDGDITNKVVVSGHVNSNEVGIYTLTYKVTDSSNNESLVTRTIKVIETNPSNNMIFLTFDDGPSSLTSKTLDILKEENVKATFFVINFSNCDIIKRIVNEGHTIAIHGYSHEYRKIYKSEEAFMNNITSLENKIQSCTGVTTKYIRFPGGSSNTVSKFNPGIMTRLTKKVTEEGYKYYDWNVSSEDAVSGGISTEKVYNNVISGLRYNRHNIVLMHDSDNKRTTQNALRKIISYGKNNGYSFANITDSTKEVHFRVNN